MRFIGSDPNILDAFYKATADGSIAAGKPVIVTVPGAPTLSSPVEFESGGTYYFWGTFDSSNNKVVFTYQDQGNSNYGTAVVGTVSGNTVSFGTPVVFESAAVEHIRCTFDTSNNKVVVAYKDGGNSNYGTAIVGTVSGTSISFGSAVVFVSFGIVDAAITFDSNENKVVICYPGSSSYGNAVIGTVSGTSISFGSPVVFESANSTYIAATFDSSNNKVVLAYKDGGNSNQGTAIVGTVSGTSISFGSANVFESGGTYYIAIAFDSSANKVIIAFADAGDSNQYEGKAVSAEVSGTSINITGNTLTFNSGTSLATGLGLALAYDSAANKMGLAYKDRGDSRASFAYLTVSGADLIRSDEVTIFSAAGPGSYLAPVYDSAAERIVIGYNDQTDSDKGKAVVAINDTGGKVKAIAESASTTPSFGTSVAFETGLTTYISVAYDTNAQKIVVAYKDNGNSDYGTAVVGTVSGTSISFGTPVVFESAGTSFTATVYDSNAQKVVIAYRDSGNSNYGTAIVGTVSGTSISFGTASVFESGHATYISAAYDSSAQKVVIAYTDVLNSSYGTAIVGTVSGTSISFGSASVFESASSDYIAVAYDSNANKIVMAYRDGDNSYYGTAVVGTVSGTSISFGSATVFESANASYMSAVYDANSQKVVIAYSDGGNADYGTAVVGTVTGTSISFGTPVVFESANATYIGAVYDANAQKVFIAYRDSGNSNYGTAVTGTVSGTSISFGSAAVFESANSLFVAAAYDSNSQKAVIAYRDVGNSNYGTGLVATPAPTSTNLTAENYIGISDAAYADAATATIGIVGCIDRNQTGLTAGQQYFVQTDGTLATTADDPSVLAGTAISATELVVKE